MQETKPKLFNNQYQANKKISSGSFGVVYFGVDLSTKEEVAIKLEKEDQEEVKSLEREVEILKTIAGVSGVPKFYWTGQEGEYNIMVIELLGRDLACQLKKYKKMCLKSVVLQDIHNKGVVHRDLKPENILVGYYDDSKIYIVDYGISKIYLDKNNKPIEFRDKKAFIGTTRYASIAAHKGYELSRKDDIESLLYVAIFLIIGQLPWQGINCSDKDRTRVVGDMKFKIEPKELCKDLPDEFAQLLEYTKKLHMMIGLLENVSKKQGFTLDNAFEWTQKKKTMNEVKKGMNQLKAQGEFGNTLLVAGQVVGRSAERKPSQLSFQGSVQGSQVRSQVNYTPSCKQVSQSEIGEQNGEKKGFLAENVEIELEEMEENSLSRKYLNLMQKSVSLKQKNHRKK